RTTATARDAATNPIQRIGSERGFFMFTSASTMRPALGVRSSSLAYARFRPDGLADAPELLHSEAGRLAVVDGLTDILCMVYAERQIQHQLMTVVERWATLAAAAPHEIPRRAGHPHPERWESPAGPWRALGHGSNAN